MRSLGKVAIVTMGLVVVAWALALVPSWAWVVASSQQQPGTNWWLTIGAPLLPTAIAVAFGYWLIARRDSLSTRLFDDTESPIAVDGFGLLRVCIIVLGLGLIIVSVPRLIGAVGTWGSYVAMTPAEASGLGPSAVQWSMLAATAVTGLAQLAAGVLFVRRSRRIAARLWRPRTDARPLSAEMSACPACDAAYDPRDYEDASSARCVECHSPLHPESVQTAQAGDGREATRRTLR